MKFRLLCCLVSLLFLVDVAEGGCSYDPSCYDLVDPMDVVDFYVPSDYQNLHTYNFCVCQPEDRVFFVDFQVFDLENNYDYLYVEDYLGTTMETMTGAISDLPKMIYQPSELLSGQSYLYFRVVTDSSISYDGVLLSAYSVLSIDLIQEVNFRRDLYISSAGLDFTFVHWEGSNFPSVDVACSTDLGSIEHYVAGLPWT